MAGERIDSRCFAGKAIVFPGKNCGWAHLTFLNRGVPPVGLQESEMRPSLYPAGVWRIPCHIARVPLNPAAAIGNWICSGDAALLSLFP